MFKHIERGPSQLPLLQQGQQIGFDQMAAARQIDQISAARQLRQRRAIENAAGVSRQRQHADQDARTLQKRAQFLRPSIGRDTWQRLARATPAADIETEILQTFGNALTEYAQAKNANTEVALFVRR